MSEIMHDLTAGQPSDRAGQRRPTGLALLALGLGLGSLALAVPRLATEAALFRQDNPSETEIYRFSANPMALPTHDSLAALRLTEQLAAADPATARLLMADARAASEAALAKAPGRARDWGLLAALGESGTVPLAEAAAAYRLAVATENFSPNLTPWLFELGLRLWPVLDDRQQAAVRDIALRQWAWQPGQMTEIAVHNHAGLLVADLLSGSPDIAKEFLRRYNFLQDLWQKRPPPGR